MKVVHLNTWNKGGAAAAARRICKAQREQGIDAHFISLHDGEHQAEYIHCYMDFLAQKYNKSIAKLIFQANRIYNQIPTGFDKKLFFNRPETLFRIHQHRLIQEADVIHLHAISKFLDYPSFFKNIDKPVVWTLHDMNPFSGGKHYDTGMKPKLIPLEQKFISTKKKAIQGKNIHIVSPSLWLKECSLESAMFGNLPHTLIPYCIDISIFKQQNKTNENRGKKVLFVAENVNDERKGFHYMLEALNYLDKNIELMVLGNAQKTDFPSDANINYLGYISSPHQMAELYNQADVFVIPSLEDNLPNTVIESHCCGTPVVGFRRTGIANMITSGVNGVLVDTLSGAALAEGIQGAYSLQNPTLRTDISQKARSFYDENRVVEAYLGVYEKMKK